MYKIKEEITSKILSTCKYCNSYATISYEQGVGYRGECLGGCSFTMGHSTEKEAYDDWEKSNMVNTK